MEIYERIERGSETIWTTEMKGVHSIFIYPGLYHSKIIYIYMNQIIFMFA